MTRRIVESLPVQEKSLIQRVRKKAPLTAGVVAGIGDDCAVLRVPAGHEVLVTTDFTLENVHFRRKWHDPEVVGRRCVTRGLSDIAAMGGEPRAAFLSLALDRRTPQKWVDQFLAGVLEAAAEFGVALAGGDTAQSHDGIQADIVLLGSVPKGKALLRSGAQAGDEIFVTGHLGGAAAALNALSKGRVRAQNYPRHFHPVARVRVGQWLRQRGLASAMIDLSDGLSTDLDHICEESGLGAIIEAEAIPRASVGRPAKLVDFNLALHGGEDYELLFTSHGKIPASIAGVPVTRIGQITRKRGMVLMRPNGGRRKLSARGWQHFEKRR